MPRPIITRTRDFAAVVSSLIAWTAWGCHNPHTTSPSIQPDGADLPVLRQVSGTHCNETTAMQLVIRDEATLAQVPLAEIDVDFDHEMLLVVTLGRVMSDHYRVTIDRVRRVRSELHVSIRIEQPPPGAPLAPATPFCIAAIPRCDLNVARFATTPPDRERSW